MGCTEGPAGWAESLARSSLERPPRSRKQAARTGSTFGDLEVTGKTRDSHLEPKTSMKKPICVPWPVPYTPPGRSTLGPVDNTTTQRPLPRPSSSCKQGHVPTWKATIQSSLDAIAAFGLARCLQTPGAMAPAGRICTQHARKFTPCLGCISIRT